MTFGQRVRAMRKGRKVSMRWLAAEASLSLTFICDLENGKTKPSAETLERLADVLGTTMDQLWRGR